VRCFLKCRQRGAADKAANLAWRTNYFPGYSVKATVKEGVFTGDRSRRAAKFPQIDNRLNLVDLQIANAIPIIQ
jgi:hypothetical protein